MMRHTASIFIGQDIKAYTAQLGKYVLKYGEADAASYFTSMIWIHDEDGKTEIKKAERDTGAGVGFVSTMQDVYETKLEIEETLSGTDRALDMRHFFKKFHQKTVTINKPGDSNSLLLILFVPLYDEHACTEAQNIIAATSDIQSHYTIMIIGLSEDIGSVISPDAFQNITADEEDKKKTLQKEMLLKFADLKLQQNTLEQIVLMQNTNSDNFALNLDQDSFLRIIGELSLICMEKYSTIFTQAGTFDREHPVTALGLSVMNLDKYYFENYLLRRSYIRILEREDVKAEEVDLNKVAVIANECLSKHRTIFSDFYGNSITPLWRSGHDQDTIISQTSAQLKNKLKDVEADLTSYVQDPKYTLPEKKAILAMILGYDDPLLKGNLFSEQQLTIDNLDEEVANCFIEANNACVKKEKKEGSDKDEIIHGPLTICANEEGKVSLPIERLQKLRNAIRQSTNYIREKNKELEEIEGMTQDAKESEKRLTENGFILDGTLYRLDIKHEEVKFDETYVPKRVTERSVDLRSGFAKIKDQGEIGACTVFSITSIFEYILKQNLEQETDLSESFVYYNVRHKDGKENEDTGSSFQDVIRSVGDLGVCTESLHPYSTGLNKQPTEEAYVDGKKRRITKALNVNITENDIKSAIQEGYPVAVSLKIYDSFNSTSGFVKRPTAAEVESADFGYHAMVIVGYTDETKHFVVRNSWGERFGDNGYCYVPYSYICDSDLNRMACVVTEVDTSGEPTSVVGGGKTGKKQIVQFNTSDARIKSYVIQNLLEEEQKHLSDMRIEDTELKTEYEKLMQTLGKQPVRTEILNEYMGVLSEKIAELKVKRANINESERAKELRNFDSQSWKNRLYMIGVLAILVILWGMIGSFFDNFIDWFKNDWCWLILGVFVLLFIFLGLYWWYVKSQRRRLEMELEDITAHLSEKIQKIEKQKEEQKMKMHVAGMVLDDLLTLKASLDKKYQGMKGYVGNLAVWYDEEQNNLAMMEPLVKDPFIPLLSNEKLNSYFEENMDKITGGMHLYEYFKEFKLDDQAIIQYKRNLKQKIHVHIKSLLKDFTIFRHIFVTRDYPFLDKEYASAKHLLPVLDSKSVPFCLVQRLVGTKPQARFLFIHTDPEEEPSWKSTYPQYFSTTPISENIESVYKIVGMRMQALRLDEVVHN